jgi:hypothetical protein
MEKVPEAKGHENIHGEMLYTEEQAAPYMKK